MSNIQKFVVSLGKAKSLKAIILFVVLGSCLIGCSSGIVKGSLPQIDAKAKSGKVILIRKSSFSGIAVSLPILLAGEEVFRIANKEVAEFSLEAGGHTVSVAYFGGSSPTWKKLDHYVFLAEGEVVYLLIEFKQRNWALREIDSVDASRFLKDYPRLNLSGGQ
jgi:hypothetical protein